MFIIAIVLGLIIAKVLGGSIKKLGLVEFHKYSYILIVLVIVDIVFKLLAYGTNTFLTGPIFYFYPFYNIISYMVFIGILELNKSLRGFRIIEAGFILNFLPMVLNSGKMPVSRLALQDLGQTETIKAMEDGLIMTHDLIGQDTNFKILADIIPLNLISPIVISIGDIVISLGIIIFIIYYTREVDI